VMNNLDVSDDASAAGLALAFGSHCQAYFIAVITEGRSLVGMLPEGADQLSIFFFEGRIFFNQAFER
jgi:hypothetical protein